MAPTTREATPRAAGVRGVEDPVSSGRHARVTVEGFQEGYPYRFDDYQVRALRALLDGQSVLVAAPTGAGKTVVGEFAAWLALQGGGKTFYTTPIKALSNQKYADFVGLHGPRSVGLLTGDNSVNGTAPIVVMTTEVLRNMIYEDSPELRGLHYVVLDEVHYLQDRYRGAVWEEILIHLPVDVQIVSLSATVSNTEEFGDWLQTLRGRTEIVIEERRPVEIRHWYFAADELLPMFVQRPDGRILPNPRGRELDRRRRRGAERPGRGGRRVHEKRARIPRRTEVIERLGGEGMLPAIYFIFSRRGCDDAVRQCLHDGVRLTTSDERQEILAYADERVAELSPNELDVLGYDAWIGGLARGVAAHHAGMIPPFKETVEELFGRGLVKAVFATETLALGINMPARTVVIESLMKFTGEKHELMTPGQYTQLSGRAGRRGIDELGHSVVLLQRFTPFDTITRLASTRTYPLQSSFQPSYNMAVNLIRTYDRAEAEHLVNLSFAQFQADRDVVQLEQSRERLEAYSASYREKTHCDLGDFTGYSGLVEELRKLERADPRAARSRGESVLRAIDALVPGDVIEIAGGKRRGRYAVLEVTRRDSQRTPRVLALSAANTMTRFAPNDLRDPPAPIGRVRLPRDFRVRDAAARRALSARLEDLLPPSPRPEPESETDGGQAGEVKAARRAVELHPCHRCPELGRHIHFADRARRLERELTLIERRIHRRTATLARRFERVLEVLEGFGYIEGWALTDKGGTLARVYNESDLLVVETLEEGLLEPLDPAEIAAVCSTLVYETRGPDAPEVLQMPTPACDEVWQRLMVLWKRVRRAEDERGLDLTREPDRGFADIAFRWARGEPLDTVLGDEDAPGDFVRSVKQLVDLLRQLQDIEEGSPVGRGIRAAIEGLHRGVVAYSSLDL
ncbi:MAG: DEAD/DEAH box helicase [Actinomycetota bacterium]